MLTASALPIARGGKIKRTLKMKRAFVCAAMALMMAGLASCAGGGRGPSDDAKITAAINTWVEGMKAKDVNKTLAVFSDKFANKDVQGKEALADYLKQNIAVGNLDGLKVTLESAKRQKVEGKPQFEVYPIEVESDKGVATIGLTLTKENNDWRITAMDVQM
jgi:ketosteroid isomerase-like protein